MSLYMQGGRVAEPQVSGQMSIEDVLAEWEKTKRAAEAALQEAEQRKLESAKARALQEAEELLGRLADVIPMLDSGLTPKDLLDQKYLSKDGQPNDSAVSMVTNMNQFLQQEIDRLSSQLSGHLRLEITWQTPVWLRKTQRRTLWQPVYRN